MSQNRLFSALYQWGLSNGRWDSCPLQKEIWRGAGTVKSTEKVWRSGCSEERWTIWYIYYLITKKRASHKPTYENLRKSLEAMKSHCLRNGVTKLSMPRQGNPGPWVKTWLWGLLSYPGQVIEKLILTQNVDLKVDRSKHLKIISKPVVRSLLKACPSFSLGWMNQDDENTDLPQPA